MFSCNLAAMLSRSVVSNSLCTHGLSPARFLCPWGFSRQEYWSGLPCPPPGDLLNPGIEPRFPTLHVDSSPSEPPGKAIEWILDWVAYSFSRGSFWSRNQPRVSCITWWILYQLSHQGRPRRLEWVAYPFSSRSSWPRNWTRISCQLSYPGSPQLLLFAVKFIFNWSWKLLTWMESYEMYGFTNHHIHIHISMILWDKYFQSKTLFFLYLKSST